MDGGLEGQHRQQAVVELRDLARAARPPGPDRRGDIADERGAGERAPEAPGDTLVEILRVDMDDRIGCSAARPSAACRMRLSSVGRRRITGMRPFTAISVKEKSSRRPSACIRGPADADKLDRTIGALPDLAHQPRAQLVARGFAGDQPDEQPLVRRAGYAVSPAGTQIDRSLPARMKSRISWISGCDSNSPATSSTRSLRVPSLAKSSR